MLRLYWIKSTADTWLGLHSVNLDGVTARGVYIIWHGGNPSRVVRVGQGDIASRLKAHRLDRAVCAYAAHGELFVTWASVADHQLDAVERHLADTWNPLVGEAWPNCAPIAVNSPWG